VLAAAAALAAAGCGRPASPNIVLITIDTLRVDRLGAYGGPAARTPHVDRLAREGVLFENAVCPMPLTRPSHFSMMTSQYPREHGVVNNAIALPAGAVTLPEVLRAAGYRTGAFVGVRLLAPSSGSAEGFQTFVGPVAEHEWAADRVVRAAMAWLGGPARGETPFFLWLHLFDPHMPYAPPEPYRPPPPGDWPQAPAEISWPGLLALADARDGALPAGVLERGLDLYTGEVAFTDHWIGELLSALERDGRIDRTVLAFTADHGECFDNGIFFEHSDCLYDGAARVPLIVRFPPAIPGGRRDHRLAENLDLAPTLLRVAGVPAPPQFRGTDLLAPAGAERAGFIERPLYQPQAATNRRQRGDRIRTVGGRAVQSVAPEVERVGLRTTRWKFIRTGAVEELYDLQADPGERDNLAARRQELATRWRDRLRQWAAAHPLHVVDHSEINPELRETLRTLGYLR
jgi:arylsulfatase A-like enzyme